jgi:hypothetical protein
MFYKNLLSPSFILKAEAADFSETLVIAYHINLAYTRILLSLKMYKFPFYLIY